MAPLQAVAVGPVQAVAPSLGAKDSRNYSTDRSNLGHARGEHYRVKRQRRICETSGVCDASEVFVHLRQRNIRILESLLQCQQDGSRVLSRLVHALPGSPTVWPASAESWARSGQAFRYGVLVRTAIAEGN